ncbi:transposase [Bathymodiolus platifrons methanotrophic gill symbiont]|uniref:transposase n=1 Tax=Bathymodiolus platifrons methanotrophic gill symbiont TaxID=113268 RepID=UPI001E4A67FF|nr:transposase [Bathymodiolus platifrons methanotrophic gill symbiont]
MATTNGSTAIRDKILASLARYRALRIGKFPCAFWRLSSRPGLTASEHRDEEAATAFFKQTINNNGFPDKVVMDKSGANYAGLANINLLLILAGFATMYNPPANPDKKSKQSYSKLVTICKKLEY